MKRRLKYFILVLTLVLGLAACGKSPEKSQLISEDQAKKIAAENFDLKAEEVNFHKIKLEKDDGIDKYELEFSKDNYNYEVELNAETKEIIKSEKEEQAVINSDKVQGNLTEEEAKILVLEKVEGALDSDFTEFKLDQENGRTIYEGELNYDIKKYEFEIDAETGEFIKWEEENR